MMINYAATRQRNAKAGAARQYEIAGRRIANDGRIKLSTAPPVDKRNRKKRRQ